MNNTYTLTKKTVSRNAAPLQNMNIMDDLVERARNRPRHLPGIVCFYGPSGFGKSTAAGYISAVHDGHYLECRSNWTKAAFLKALCSSMNLPPKKTIYEMVDQVSEDLAVSQKPLILDEYDHAIDRNLIELVRDIYEQSNCPIIIIGEERLPHKLQKWERFHGRIMDMAQAQPADLSDAQALCKHYTPNVTIKDDLLQHLVEVANGSVRRIVTNLDRIAKFAKSEGLKSIGLAEWGGRELHTGALPKLRSF